MNSAFLCSSNPSFSAKKKNQPLSWFFFYYQKSKKWIRNLAFSAKKKNQPSSCFFFVIRKAEKGIQTGLSEPILSKHCYGSPFSLAYRIGLCWNKLHSIENFIKQKGGFYDSKSDRHWLSGRRKKYICEKAL